MEVLEGLSPGFVLARRAGLLRSNSGGTHQSAGTMYRAASSEDGAESARVRYGGGRARDEFEFSAADGERIKVR